MVKRSDNVEVLEPEPAYNDTSLSPQDFLLAVMHDKRLPMSARIDAASKVSVYVHPRLAQVTQEMTGGIKIIIEGGLPELPGTNIIMPATGHPQPASMNGAVGNPNPDPQR